MNISAKAHAGPRDTTTLRRTRGDTGSVCAHDEHGEPRARVPPGRPPNETRAEVHLLNIPAR
jgi:hypothetical protein